MKASLSLTKGMREAQQEGMRTVFKEIKEATQRDITAAVKEALAQQPADLAATITQALKEREQRLTEKLDEQAARLGATHAQASNIHLLLSLLLKMLVDLFATQFSLFKFNGWKKV